MRSQIYKYVLGSVVRVDPNADKGDALIAQILFNIKPKALRSDDPEKRNKNTLPREEGSED